MVGASFPSSLRVQKAPPACSPRLPWEAGRATGHCAPPPPLGSTSLPPPGRREPWKETHSAPKPAWPPQPALWNGAHRRNGDTCLFLALGPTALPTIEAPGFTGSEVEGCRQEKVVPLRALRGPWFGGAAVVGETGHALRSAMGRGRGALLSPGLGPQVGPSAPQAAFLYTWRRVQ